MLRRVSIHPCNHVCLQEPLPEEPAADHGDEEEVCESMILGLICDSLASFRKMANRGMRNKIWSLQPVLNMFLTFPYDMS